MSAPRTPSPRDQESSPFSQILEGFWCAHPSVLAAAFVDEQGECVDYFSSIDPFEAKIAGAHLRVCVASLRDGVARAGMGRARLWIVEAERRDLVVARATDEYMVVLVLRARGLTARMLQAVDSLIEALGREAGFDLEWGSRVHVDVGRDARGQHLPLALQLREETIPVLSVKGRWLERGALSTRALSCYRVALPDRDVTIVHDPTLDSWRLR